MDHFTIIISYGEIYFVIRTFWNLNWLLQRIMLEFQGITILGLQSIIILLSSAIIFTVMTGQRSE